MIPKHIPRTTVDNYSRLGLYLAAAKEEGEKLDLFWMTNFNAGDGLEDLDLALIEAETTQALNLRAKKDKTYHLMISFREERPSVEALKDIAQEAAKSIGFEDHQYIVATHQNTDNYHMHIAFNKIHPQTYKAHTPSYDYRKLDTMCRRMEKKWGIGVDNGMDKSNKNAHVSQKSRDYEAKTWEQSFDSYVRERNPELMRAKDKAKSWQDLHKAMRAHHIEIKPRGNGLVIVSLDGKHAIKASALDRSFSKPALEKKLGRFQGPDAALKQHRPKGKGYQKKPRFYHKDQARLWRKFNTPIKRKENLAVKAFRTWRDFLTYEALSDPLAMAIIQFNKKMIQAAERLLAPERKKEKHTDLRL